LLRRTIAEKLTQRLFVICNAVLLNETDEIRGRVAREGRFCEMGIGGEKIAGLRVQIRKVAAAPAGDEDLFAGTLSVLEQRDTAAAAAGFNGGHEARSARAEDEDIESVLIHCANFIY
jgi:hypothetical protein